MYWAKQRASVPVSISFSATSHDGIGTLLRPASVYRLPGLGRIHVRRTDDELPLQFVPYGVARIDAQDERTDAEGDHDDAGGDPAKLENPTSSHAPTPSCVVDGVSFANACFGADRSALTCAANQREH